MKSDLTELNCIIYYMSRQVSEPDEVSLPKYDFLSVKDVPVTDLNAYKEIYKKFGEPWLWTDRSNIDIHYFLKNIKREDVFFPCLFLHNEMIGFSEVKCGFESKAENAEIVYFSVLSDLTGKGFGKFLMKSILSKLAEKGISKVFLNTCTFDHMYALDFYKRFNFKIYERKNKKIDIEKIGKDIFENSKFYKRSF